MDTQKVCEHCGKPLDARTVHGLCPDCLFKAGLGSESGGGRPQAFVAPKPEDLGPLFPQLEILELLGKGGMGARTLEALEQTGAVYLNAVGGAAQFYARTIERVDGVSLLEFGTPEAMWHLTVRDFPAIVTMDAHGNSLHRDVEAESAKALAALAH